MASNINISENNREKLNNSHGSLSKFNYKINKKTSKTPEIIFIEDNKKQSSINAINPQKRKSTVNLEPIFSYQPLTLTKDESQNDFYDIMYKKYFIIISKYEKIISELSKINQNIDINTDNIEQLKKNLQKLKEDKKNRQIDMVNLLSNKESLEEIYKNKVYYLIKSKDLKLIQKMNNNNKKDEKIKIIHKVTDSGTFKIDEENVLEIKTEEIKKSDKKKFIEQTINFTEDIFQKKEEEFNNKIKEKINLAYKVFFSEINSAYSNNTEYIITNFFSRIAVFISNHSLGNYSETNINKFLRYLLKINSIGVDIFKIIKFLNKKYKEKKNEIKEKINNLNKRNEDLNEKKIHAEIKKGELEKKIEKKKEILKNLEKNRNKLKNENNRNIISDRLNALTNINYLKQYQLKSENNNEINKVDNNNYYYNLKELINIKYNKNNINEKNNELISNNTSKNIFKNQKDNSNNNFNYMKKENENIKLSNRENNSINKSQEVAMNRDSMDTKIILNRKIKIGLDKIKNKKVSMNQIFKNNNNKSTEKDYGYNIFNINEKKYSKRNNVINKINSENNIHLDNNRMKINYDINNNMKDINKNSTINVNNLVINNDIKIKNINSLMKIQKEKDIFNNNNNKSFQKKMDFDASIYFSKKNADIIKINKNNDNSNNNIINSKDISVNDNNNKDNNSINGINENNKNILYDNQNFNFLNKKYNNKNIYIINNINNSEKLNINNNFYNSNQYKKINNSHNSKNLNEDSSLYNNNKTFENNRVIKNSFLNADNKNISNKNNMTNEQKYLRINETKEEKNNHSYNFYDILQSNKKESIIKNIPIKKIDNSKIKNNSSSSYIKLTKNNKSNYQKNIVDYSKNVINNNGRNNDFNVRKKLTDNNLIQKYNENKIIEKPNINMNYTLNNYHERKITGKENHLNTDKKINKSNIQLSSYINSKNDKNNKENIKKTLFFTIGKTSNLSP